MEITITTKRFLLRGAGGGVGTLIFVKLVFERAVAQKTYTRDRTFKGVVDAHRYSVAATPIFGPILAQLCQIV